MYLASAGVGTLILADHDTVEISNLQRQIIHTTERLGMLKAESGKQAIHALNPSTKVETLLTRMDDESLSQTIARVDLVVDCTDNFSTRHAINRACVKHRVPLVSGAAVRFDGQISVFDSRHAASPCYHCLFPEAQDVEAINCATMGVFAPLVGIIGTMQAAEAIKVLSGAGNSLVGRLLILDALDMRWHSVKVRRDPGCAVCGAAKPEMSA
jgi:adenylyltransferase/sulfurtransferase